MQFLKNCLPCNLSQEATEKYWDEEVNRQERGWKPCDGEHSQDLQPYLVALGTRRPGDPLTCEDVGEPLSPSFRREPAGREAASDSLQLPWWAILSPGCSQTMPEHGRVGEPLAETARLGQAWRYELSHRRSSQSGTQCWRWKLTGRIWGGVPKGGRRKKHKKEKSIC